MYCRLTGPLLHDVASATNTFRCHRTSKEAVQDEQCFKWLCCCRCPSSAQASMAVQPTTWMVAVAPQRCHHPNSAANKEQKRQWHVKIIQKARKNLIILY